MKIQTMYGIIDGRISEIDTGDFFAITERHGQFRRDSGVKLDHDVMV